MILLKNIIIRPILLLDKIDDIVFKVFMFENSENRCFEEET